PGQRCWHSGRRVRVSSMNLRDPVGAQIAITTLLDFPNCAVRNAVRHSSRVCCARQPSLAIHCAPGSGNNPVAPINTSAKEFSMCACVLPLLFFAIIYGWYASIGIGAVSFLASPFSAGLARKLAIGSLAIAAPIALCAPLFILAGAPPQI